MFLSTHPESVVVTGSKAVPLACVVVQSATRVAPFHTSCHGNRGPAANALGTTIILAGDGVSSSGSVVHDVCLLQADCSEGRMEVVGVGCETCAE